MITTVLKKIFIFYDEIFEIFYIENFLQLFRNLDASDIFNVVSGVAEKYLVKN